MLIKQAERKGINETWINPNTDVRITYAVNGVNFAIVSFGDIYAAVEGRKSSIDTLVAIVSENKPVMEIFCDIDALDALVTYEDFDGNRLGWIEIVERLKPVMA